MFIFLPLSNRYLLLLLPFFLMAAEPITPLPQSTSYDSRKAEIGKKLFFEPNLSKDKTISCSSCHNLYEGGTDNKPVSTGVGGLQGTMNSPTVYNAFFNYRLFWNGRVKTLKEQAMQPLTTHFEMGMQSEDIEHFINSQSSYQKEFRAIYGNVDVTFEMVAEVLAEFQKTLITPDSKLDLYLKGKSTLNDIEHKGYILFKQLGCVVCHHGVNVGGTSFQKIGAVYPYPWKEDIKDRYHETKDPADKNVFRVPSLRNIAQGAPYFHDGSIATLKDAIRLMAFHNLGIELEPTQISELETFLKTLTGVKPKEYR